MKPGSWRPVLSGRSRDEALEVAVAIARGLERTPFSRWHPKVPASVRKEWWLLLNTGVPSRILLLAYLARTGVMPEARGQAAQLFDRAVRALPRTHLEPWLLKGFTGLAWLNQHLAALEIGSAYGNGDIDRALLRLLARRWNGHFDLLYGLVGLGIYGLERLPRPEAREIVVRVVDQLDRQAERRKGFVTWLTPPGEIAFTPRGSYSLGMAHGVPAVIGFLARAHEAGVARRRVRALVDGAVASLRAQRLPLGSGSSFPPWTYPGGAPGPSRAAWCYGDPCIAAALYRAGQALGRPGWTRAALFLMRRTATRSQASSGVRDATLCHGAVGLAHQLNRFWQTTGDQRFANTARRWYRRALDYRRRGRGVAGFERFGMLHAIAEPTGGAGRARWSADPGFLTGAAGIGLALLAAATPVEPAWDRLLLLDTPGLRPPMGRSPGGSCPAEGPEGRSGKAGKDRLRRRAGDCRS
jgi:lantibiotic biosynthesis protein